MSNEFIVMIKSDVIDQPYGIDETFSSFDDALLAAKRVSNENPEKTCHVGQVISRVVTKQDTQIDIAVGYDPISGYDSGAD